MTIRITLSLAALIGALSPQDPPAEDVIRRLGDADPNVRRKAIHEAEYIDLQFAGPRLIELLGDPEVAEQASRALEYLEVRIDPASLLARVLEGRVEFEPARPLLTMWSGPEQHIALLKAVQDEKCAWRGGALRILGESGARNAVPLALEWIDSEDHPLREDAVRYLVEVREAGAIPKLRRWASSSEPHECQTAIRALADLNAKDVGPDVLKIVKEGTDIHKQIPGCAFSGGCEIFDYRELIAATDPGLIVGTLQNWLKDCDPRLRGDGANFLALIKHAESIPKIGALLRDSEKSVRGSAIAALGTLKARDYLKPILEFANGGNGTAAYALGELGGPEAVAALLRLSRDPSEDVRLNALEGLAITDPAACGAQIIHALEVEKCWRLNRVIGLAGTIKARAAAPALVRFIDDPDQHVREYARDALRKIRPSELADEIARRGKELDEYEREYTLNMACGLGSRLAGKWLLEDAVKGENVSLAALNALRAPAAWEKMAGLAVGRDPVSISSLLKEGAARAGLDYKTPMATTRRMRHGLDKPRSFGLCTLEEALQWTLLGVLIDPHEIRIVTHAEAIAFWKKWFSEAQR